MDAMIEEPVKIEEPKMDLDPKSRNWNKVFTILAAVTLMVAVVAVVGLGVLAYQLNTRLTATQKQLATLQGDFNKLKADNVRLTSDLTQANTNLDNAKSDLAKSQDDLQIANSEKSAQRAKIDAAKNLMPVIDAMYVSGENVVAIDAKINKTGDASLVNLWNALVKTPNPKNIISFNEYLFGVIDTAVK
jgi:preprotein translocase subunit SecF